MLKLWGGKETKVLPEDTCEHPDDRRWLEIKEVMPDGFRRIIQISGAYRCSKPFSDGKGHGISSMRMFFILVGPKGAVQWLIDTGWHTRTTQAVQAVIKDYPMPHAWDLGFHAPASQYDGQSRMECGLVDGGACYYDGTGLSSVRFTPDFLTHPGAIWDALRVEYDRKFGRKKHEKENLRPPLGN